MLILAIGTGIMSWFISLTVLRRILLQPELIRRAKLWIGLSVVLVAGLFALTSTFILTVVNPQFFDPYVFLVAFSLFLVLSLVTGVRCIRKVSV